MLHGAGETKYRNKTQSDLCQSDRPWAEMFTCLAAFCEVVYVGSAVDDLVTNIYCELIKRTGSFLSGFSAFFVIIMRPWIFSTHNGVFWWHCQFMMACFLVILCRVGICWTFTLQLKNLLKNPDQSVFAGFSLTTSYVDAAVRWTVYNIAFPNH